MAELYFQFESPAAKVSGLKFVYLNDPTQEQFALTQTEVPIYGAGKLGTYYPAQDASVDYELTDHLPARRNFSEGGGTYVRCCARARW